MSLISIAAEQPARLSASPNGPEPLRVAAASLRVHPVGDVTPASVVADPPRQTLRTDMLTSGYVPGSQSDKLFAALSKGGKADMPLQAMFWGGYFGILVDKFGIRWMFNCASAT